MGVKIPKHVGNEMFSEEIFPLPFAVPPLTHIKVIKDRGLNCCGLANVAGCWPGQQKAQKSLQERKQACFIGIKIIVLLE